MYGLVELSDELAGRLWRKIADYENPLYGAWAKDCLENRSFYFGHQASASEIEKLQARGQYYIVVNKIRKALRAMTGMLSAAIPKYKVVPYSKEGCVRASVASKLLDWVWNNSGGIHLFRRILKDCLIDNIRYAHIIFSKDKRIKIVAQAFDEVLVDPQSHHPMFEDAEMIIIKRYVPVEYVKSVYGVTNLVTEVPTTFHALTSDTELQHSTQFITRVFSGNALYVNLYECYRKEYYRNEDGAVLAKIIKETALGFRHAFREELPIEITDYPIIPFYVEDTSNPYKRGEVHFLKDLQRFINKAYGVVLLNAQLMSNPKLVMRETDIPGADLKAFQENYSKPGSINILTGNAELPMVIDGQPLNAAFFTLYQDAKHEIGQSSLPEELVSGSVTGINATNYSHLLDQKEIVLDALKDFTSLIDLACIQIGKVALQYCAAYLDPTQLVFILDSTGATARHAADIQQGLNVADEKSVAEFIRLAQENQLDEAALGDKLAQAQLDADFVTAIQSVTDYVHFTDLDIHIISGSYSPTYDMAMLRLMLELANMHAVDPSMILRYVPTENRAELEERFDTIRQLQTQNTVLEEENKDLKDTLKSVEGMVVTERINAETARAKVKLDKLRAEEKVKNLMRKYENNLTKKEQRIEFEKELIKLFLEIERAELDKTAKEIEEQQNKITFI